MRIIESKSYKMKKEGLDYLCLMTLGLGLANYSWGLPTDDPTSDILSTFGQSSSK